MSAQETKISGALLERIWALHREASEAWTIADWRHELDTSDWPQRDRETPYCEGGHPDCQVCADAEAEAIECSEVVGEAIETHRISNVLSAAKWARSIELAYGESPAWGTFQSELLKLTGAVR